MSLTETGLLVIENRTGAITHQVEPLVTAAWWAPDGARLVMQETIFAESPLSRLFLLPLTEENSAAEPAAPVAADPTPTSEAMAFYSCNTDLNLSWRTPKGWFVRGFQVYNYPEQADPSFRPTPEHVRIDIFSIEDANGRSLEEIVEEQRDSAEREPPGWR